jgi:hypothetical protein
LTNVLDLVFAARIIDAHFGGALALFHLTADAAQRRRRQNAFGCPAYSEIKYRCQFYRDRPCG